MNAAVCSTQRVACVLMSMRIRGMRGQVVPNSASRASLGETSESGLIDIFRREFGAPGSQRFEDARDNFIKSSAGWAPRAPRRRASRTGGRDVADVTGCPPRRYAVASFLLQAKDRHNGNILLDTQGHLVHIDFGFVLEISPGNNMRFESAAFKLSHEMCQLLDPGGQRTSPSFKMFEELCIKGYLAVRPPATERPPPSARVVADVPRPGKGGG